MNKIPARLTDYNMNLSVLIITRNRLLGDLLYLLLADVFSPVYQPTATQPESLLQAIALHLPQVIVVEDGVVGAPFLSRMNEGQSRGRRRIIFIHPEKNSVQVNDQALMPLTQATDLFALIEGSPI